MTISKGCPTNTWIALLIHASSSQYVLFITWKTPPAVPAVRSLIVLPMVDKIQRIHECILGKIMQTSTNRSPSRNLLALLAFLLMADSLSQALTAAQATASVGSAMDDDQSVDIEEEEEEEEEDDDDDDDIDAEAQEIARRLGQQLWEDFNKAQAAQTAHGVSHILPPTQKQSRKEESVLSTMKSILSLVDRDPVAENALETALLPDSAGNVLEILRRSVSATNVFGHLCMPLSHTLVSLAKSETLFGSLRHSNIPSLELHKGKRRREEGDENLALSDQRPPKRPFLPAGDLYARVSEAVRIITQALIAAPPSALESTLVASIRLQLHQVFLFAVTSSARGGQDMHALQEISGLIQVIGVLSGIQIGQPHEALPTHSPLTTSWMNQSNSYSPITDIGTAVYPCLTIGCSKTFARLYSLRAHQRNHSIHRPFCCTTCPASFARNHDLKRHVRLHDKKAWKCGGCQKIFSRRDAIKRHKNGSKTRGPKGEICISAEVLEVDLDEENDGDSLREERRARLWTSIATQGINAQQAPYRDSGVLEEGELLPTIITNTQAVVLSLQGLLQSHVGSALSISQEQPMSTSGDPTNGQATLASVIARAQTQTLPAYQVSCPVSTDPTASTLDSSVLPSPAPTENREPQDVAMNTPIRDMSMMPSLSLYGLSDEQAKMLELAIANAASAAQAQAEAEAALEEEEEESSDEGSGNDTDDQEIMT